MNLLVIIVSFSGGLALGWLLFSRPSTAQDPVEFRKRPRRLPTMQEDYERKQRERAESLNVVWYESPRPRVRNAYVAPTNRWRSESRPDDKSR